MYNGTIIQQGKFTSDGTDKILKIRSDIDWMEVINYTEAITNNQDHGIRYTWFRNTTVDAIPSMGTKSLVEYHPAGDQTLAIAQSAAGAFTLIDTSTYSGGSWIAINGDGTNATRPVYTPASTAGLYAGNIVRIKGTDHTDINGRDFSIDDIDNGGTNFRLANTLATAPGAVAGVSGYYKLVAPNLEVYRLFTPSHRVVCNVTAAASGVVTTLVDHGYEEGQKVRFSIPSTNSMVELDGLVGTITAKTASTFTVDINTSAFTAFTYPTIADVTAAGAINNASVIPVGENASSTYSANTGDAVYNQGFIGMILGAGLLLPAGSTDDVIYWKAGKSFSYDNE